MKHLMLAFSTAAFVGAATVASAQAPAPDLVQGAQRVEVGIMPGGGTFFTRGANDEADFSNYALGLNATFNMNRFVGIETELGGGLGTRQTMTVNGDPFDDLRSPNTLAYNANLVLHTRGTDREIVPYVTAGLGGLTMYSRDELAPLNLTENQTYFTQNVGAGLKWWPTDVFGVRGDYRFIIVNGRDNVEPFFGLDRNRYGHRLTGSLVWTFGGYGFW